MSVAFFPIHIYAEETPHFTASEYSFRPTFMKSRPKDLTWYAYDVVIKSPTLVNFVVYGMRNNCSGGIGSRLFDFDAEVPAELTRKYIVKHANYLATMRREQELINAENLIIAGYAEELLKSIELKEPDKTLVST